VPDTTATTATKAPDLADWPFGGYPYGLMTLTLPDPDVRRVGGDFAEVTGQLRMLGTDGAADRVHHADSIERLLWFRWITGNQAACALWQILDDELALVLGDEVASAAANAERLLDGYSALLIYTGTPTRALYRELIRPAMGRQHRSFSGRWAQDYVPVMAKLQALRSRYRGRPRPAPIESLIEASKRNHRTHVAVAAKLVPGEESLLRANDGGALAGASADTVRLYDAFYSTRRSLVTREEVVAQLLVRIRAILWDLRINDLYPAGSGSRHEWPAEMWGDDLRSLERRVTDVLRTAGEAAAASLRRSAP
jgi:hypothetical protein